MKNNPMRNVLYFCRNSFLNIVQTQRFKKCQAHWIPDSHILSLTSNWNTSMVFQSTYSQAAALVNSSEPLGKVKVKCSNNQKLILQKIMSFLISLSSKIVS